MSKPATGVLTPAQFVAKWSAVELSERAASQEHFIDLCRMLGQPTPAEHDATGAEYTFEKGVTVTASASKGSKGEGGFADVWWRGKFAWEYKRKGKYKTLDEAYRQLCQYRESLDNPPLLIVSDITRTEIHTNFTGTAKLVHTINLADLADPASLDLLRRVFTAPDSFKPTLTPHKITEDVARQFATLAKSLGDRGHDPHTVAHFLMKCMFCLFAEDVGLLPADLFKRTLSQWAHDPKRLIAILTSLFDAMRTGGAFGPEPIDWFNGGLFDEQPALELTESEAGILIIAAKQDWANVEPAIFGTLFERSLDPTKRAQIGAHYTSRDDILLIVEPVIMAPLRREWEAVQAEVDKQLERRRKATTAATRRKADDAINTALQDFMHRLASLRILDPACGSGNFLYVAIQQLLTLEKEIITYAARPEISIGLLPTVRPTQLHGIEINPYAAELAQVVIWIGYLQWMRDNGFNAPRDPILDKLNTIENRDAILNFADPENPKAAMWPPANYIIGNPPFLGSKVMRLNGLADDYIAALHAAYELPNASDLCCYWFELARKAIDNAKNYGGKGLGNNPLGDEPLGGCPANVRAGLLATQGIRGGDNRVTLKRIVNSGGIFMAWSDRNWILDGAAVHVSIVGFDVGQDGTRTLNGIDVSHINTDLTAGDDVASADRLAENLDIYQRPPEKGAKFEIAVAEARDLLNQPNPHGRPNSNVLKPWINGQSLIGRRDAKWIIDFEDIPDEPTASLYELPYKLAASRVKPDRANNRDLKLRELWWRYRRSGEGVRNAAKLMTRLLCTTMVSKHRIFTWIESVTQPDKTITVFARPDDYFMGVLHSSVHENWSRRVGTQLREAESGFRYTPTTCFETFPLPWSPGKEPADHPAFKRISEAARELNEQRERWLNPPEWIDPIAKRIDAADDFSDVPAEARSLIRQSAIMAAAAKDPRLKKRTLTNLYNERPTWLKLAHEKLDRAVLAAYVATDPAGEWSEDWAEVWRETGAGQPLPADDPLAARRAEVDQQVLANLLRLNQERAG